MPEWIYESGIGENRAILVEDGAILEAAIEIAGEVRSGSIVAGRLARMVDRWRHAIVTTRFGDILIRSVPPGMTLGQAVHVEIVREAIVEPDNPKSLIGRVTDSPEREAPPLAERIGPHREQATTGPDLLEQAGWSDLLEEAVSGQIPFEGGELRLSLTPAMTLIDVDGWLPPAELAIAGARASALAIRRHGISGSIGIDLPTVASRDIRQRAAAALDAHLPQPFERTAVNGFGFLQVVRRRSRQSLPEIVQASAADAAARALLRRAERVPGLGARLLIASPPVARVLEQRHEWLDELRRRIGAEIRLQAKPELTTWAFHVQSSQS